MGRLVEMTSCWNSSLCRWELGYGWPDLTLLSLPVQMRMTWYRDYRLPVLTMHLHSAQVRGPVMEIPDDMFWQCPFCPHRWGMTWYGDYRLPVLTVHLFFLHRSGWPVMEISDDMLWQHPFCPHRWEWPVVEITDYLSWRCTFILCRSGWPVMEIPDNMSWQRPFCPHRWEWCWSPSCLSSRQHLWRHSTTQTALSAWRLRLPWATWSSSMCELTPCSWSCSQEWRHQMIPASSEWCRWKERGIQPDVHGLAFHTRFRIRVLSFSLIVKVDRMFSPSEEFQQHVWPHENQVTETAFHVEQRLIELNHITDD